MLMVDKKTRLVVKVYGFVCDDGIIKAVTYQDDPFLKLRKFVDRDPDKKYDKVLTLVCADQLTPFE